MCPEAPFDDQTQARVWLETEAMSVIMQAVQSRELKWVGSTVLELENGENPWQFRRESVSQWLRFASRRQTVTPEVEQRALQLEKEGLKSIDAAHFACSEAADAAES